MTGAPAPVAYDKFLVRIREVEVVRCTPVSATMRRLTLGGPGAVAFESGIFDEHVKLIFPDPETGELRLPTENDEGSLDWPRPFPTSREYTIRAYRPEVDEFDIDFVIHDGGLASDWARDAQPGSRLHVAGPPGGYRVSDLYDFYVAVADETSLPALARWLEEMPRTHRGHAVIAVSGPQSQQELAAPEGVQVTWLHHGEGAPTVLHGVPDIVTIPAGARVFAWLAGEAGSIKPLRAWVRQDLGLGKEHSSITGYWKFGSADTHEHLDDDED
ncbi:siderophore-interacting protein [Demequina sp.]|uniref:siderophore-interacting protein n=1 Tax=Demequina sp. TaxID=2050685 RepID=UPI003A8C70C5